LDRSLAPQLRIVFAAPGFFLEDTRMTVLLDGLPIYQGSFTSGMDVCGAVQPGMHRIQTVIGLPAGLSRARSYEISVPPGPGITVLLSYSRFWGNFTRRPTIEKWPV
jgi:hypothetical protein